MPTDAPDDAPFLGPADRDSRPASGATALRSTLVRYESGADRRTVFPDDADEHERRTRWLSADDDAFVDLGTAR